MYRGISTQHPLHTRLLTQQIPLVIGRNIGARIFRSAPQRRRSSQRRRHPNIHSPIRTLSTLASSQPQKDLLRRNKSPLASRSGVVCRISESQRGFSCGQRCVKKAVRICSFGTGMSRQRLFHPFRKESCSRLSCGKVLVRVDVASLIECTTSKAHTFLCIIRQLCAFQRFIHPAFKPAAFAHSLASSSCRFKFRAASCASMLLKSVRVMPSLA